MNPRPQSVAIIVRVMDRADELRSSLPSLLNQDYPDYSVVIVDHSSQDGLDSVLETMKSPRLRVLRCPRPQYFNRSRAGNIGVRYSFSDLLFFLDTGVEFRDQRHLSTIVAAFEDSREIDDSHYERWRQVAGYPALRVKRAAEGDESDRHVYCECECHGLHLLVSRGMFQRLGGLNEALLDWGYEDTDLTTRLEICGYGRIPIRELVENPHSDDLRVRFHRETSKTRSWTKNRLTSDGFINTFGPLLRTQRTPGFCDWIEIDGVSYQGTEATQQDWTMETAATLPRGRASGSHPPRDGTPGDGPLVSVVVPTKNAAEYLVVVLDSILSQDYPNIECLVMDGGSTDATLAILASYGDRITWTSQSDRGAFDAINNGWQSSRGEILAWLNVDDLWAPGGVAAAVKCFQDDHEVDVIYGDCLIIDADGQLLETRRPPDWDLGYAVENCHHMIDQPAAFIRRASAQRGGWLYPAWFHDWELWRRVSLAGGKLTRVPHLLGCARVRVDNSQYRPDILVAGLVGLTRRFFSLPDLPADIRGLRHRALSNCYLRIVLTLQFGRPGSRFLRLILRFKAFAADPTNLPNILRTRPEGRRPLRASSRAESKVEHPEPTARASVRLSGTPGVDISESTPATQSPRDPSPWPERRVLVSVVVPCKNDARYLPNALESILSQDYADVECIVVDGGSTDGTIDLLKRYGDKIRWLSGPDNGAFDAINRGWKLSKGQILAWLNADDLWEPGAVRTAVDFFEHRPDIDVVYGTVGLVDEIGRFHGDLVPGPWDLEYALRYCDHIIYQAASFIRRPILEEVGWLYPAWCHDHDLWLRIARAGGSFARLSTRLGSDRMRSENLGGIADIVIPAKIALTKRFFAEPGLPPKLQRLQRRAISSAYVRAVDYFRIDKPRHWLIAARFLVMGIVVDPRNVRLIGERFTRPFRWRLNILFAKVWPPVSSVGSFAWSTAAPMRRFCLLFRPTTVKQWMGEVVGRVLVHRNRTLTLQIEGLNQRVEDVAHMVSETLQPMAAQIDRLAVAVASVPNRIEREHNAIVVALESVTLQNKEFREELEGALDRRVGPLAAAIPQLADRIDRDRHAIVTALDSLRLRNEELRKDLEEGLEHRPPNPSDAGLGVYGTPPTLRRIPGWHSAWGIESQSDPLLQDRLDLWSALKNPVLMRWLADLLVMIWPGNELSRLLFLTGNFEPNELTWMTQTLTQGMTMIDVGAHMGVYSMIASKLVGESGVVLALEPSTREFQRLAFHVTLNRLQNVHCVQVAASDRLGEATLKIAWERNSGHNTFGEFFSPEVEMRREERVRTQTLDSLVVAEGLRRVDLIKIDVEGHELKLLTGAVETLSRFRPMVLIEVFEETLRRQGTSAEAIVAFFEGRGYVLKEFSLATGELGPLTESSGSRNLVALPA